MGIAGGNRGLQKNNKNKKSLLDNPFSDDDDDDGDGRSFAQNNKYQGAVNMHARANSMALNSLLSPIIPSSSSATMLATITPSFLQQSSLSFFASNSPAQDTEEDSLIFSQSQS